METETCKDCKKPFELTQGEIYFYTHVIADNGDKMQKPKRCRACRILRKKNNAKTTH